MKPEHAIKVVGEPHYMPSYTFKGRDESCVK